MKNRILLPVFLLLVSVPVFSQSVFNEGYVIKNNNDTVFGLLQIRGNSENALSCIFKVSKESQAIQFKPDEIKGYRYTDSKYYVSRLVRLNDKDQLLFLEYLINGTVDVFYYFDGQNERYFIDGGDNNLVELKESESIIHARNQRLILPVKPYVGILKYVFRESPSTAKRAEETQLSRKSLINIAHAYHTEMCSNEECIIYEKKHPNDNVNFGVLVAADYAMDNGVFEGYHYNYQQSYFGASLGLFVNAKLPFITPQLSVQDRLMFCALYAGAKKNQTLYAIENLSNISNKVLFRYELLAGEKLRPVLQIGAFTDYGTINRIDPFATINYGPVGGLGITINTADKKTWLIDFLYQKGFGLNHHSIHYFSLGIGYQF